MKQQLIILALSGLTGILLLSGCYTQLGTMSNQRGEERNYNSAERYDDNDTTYGNGNGEYQDNGYSYDTYYENNYRPRMGFSYYYPSTYWPSYAFSAAYSNPWCYDPYWSSYDPWLCGTPYVTYPYYGYYPPSYYYYPSYYRSHYYGGYASGSLIHRTNRTVGSTRGSVSPRGGGETRVGDSPNYGGSGSTLPSAVRVDRAAGQGGGFPKGAAVKEDGRRGGSSQRGVGRSVDRGTVYGNRAYGTRGNATREGNRGGDTRQPSYQPNSGAQPVPPPYAIKPRRDSGRVAEQNRGGNRDEGSSRGGNTPPPNYTPPPSHAPSSAPAPAPAPRSGGSGQQGGRSGSTRGGRP